MSDANLSTITRDWVLENIHRHKLGALDAEMTRRVLVSGPGVRKVETARQITACEAREAIHMSCVHDLQTMLRTVTR